jgi:GMP synthase (glutamine-hydrolysing)
MNHVLVIQHVPHETLGTFEPAFKAAGLILRPLKAYDPRAAWPPITDVDGLVAMGGPQSACELAKYPYLKREVALLRQAVDAGRPVLGVCLGAQLLAAALEAKVTKNPQKEIGWYPLMREPGADGDPMWDIFGQTETVFQWHGDAFALPPGAVQLASSPLCAQQAFRYGTSAYGLQFHVEVTAPTIRLWLQQNAAELASLRGVIDPAAIRSQSPVHLARLAELSRHIATAFCALVQPTRRPSHAR